MNALLAALSLVMGIAVALLVPGGATALLICVALALIVGSIVHRIEGDKNFLLRIFISALLVRVLIGTIIYAFKMQEFFGGDALTYDFYGYAQLRLWFGETFYRSIIREWVNVGASGWGMVYLVAGIYGLIGRNMLAIQYFNAVIGAATAPVIFLCARHMFQNLRVARFAAIFVAFYPSLVLWSSQGLKDGPTIFLLALAMLATLKLGERFSGKYFAVMVCALLGLLSLRFYIFYMVAAAIGGAFIIGMRPVTSQSLMRQVLIIAGVGLVLTYVGVLRTASLQIGEFGNLQAAQVARADLATSAQSGFGRDVDVSTTAGALTAIPLGLIYLLFAPFPWQLANLRQSITLPEMIVWWASFPLLVLGIWFTIKYRMRQALPVLIFTSMLTLAYSIFQGNVGTAYRQRSQLLVFYFIFVAVGYVLLKEQKEDRMQRALAQKLAYQTGEARMRAVETMTRKDEWESLANRLSEKIGF